jgi:hypothetical protein
MTGIVLAGLLWLVVAVVAGAAGALQGLRPPAPQLVVAALTLLVLLATALVPPLRRWAGAADPRTLVAPHVTRLFAGTYFLVLYRAGVLPYAFAVPGGTGDALVALLALGLLAAVSPLTARGRRLYTAWNVLGLLDILYVVVTAGRLGAADPASMGALLRLPLSVLPTFLVPLIIASHVVLAIRLAGGRKGTTAAR